MRLTHAGRQAARPAGLNFDWKWIMSQPLAVRVEELDHLHDAPVAALTWRTAGDRPREVVLSVTVPADAGGPFAGRRGRPVEVVFTDAVVVRFRGCGAVSGVETLDSASSTLLDEAQADRDRLTAVGLFAGDQTATLAFHSGSELSIACARVEWVDPG